MNGESGPDTAKADTPALLRLAVGQLRQRHRYDGFPPRLYVGSLGGPSTSLSAPSTDPVLDPGTRTDVVLALVDRLLDEQRGHRPDELADDLASGPAIDAWLTRPGEPTVQDPDLAWLSATVRALGVLGREPGRFWVVTRTGWLDVRTGEARTWRRLRL